ncbi:hypothetical protein HDU76_013370 [Blyttiomyces sp. JEL0837]|nr:hypothetical protein HDU76_013370 [Blyttiomyces sp. JEL0837]
MKSFTTILVATLVTIAQVAQSAPTVGIQLTVAKMSTPTAADKCLDRARDLYADAYFYLSDPQANKFIDCDPYCRFVEYADNSNPYTGIEYQRCV